MGHLTGIRRRITVMAPLSASDWDTALMVTMAIGHTDITAMGRGISAGAAVMFGGGIVSNSP